MQDLVKIFRCPGGLIHLSIGAMTVRLSRESFLEVCQAMALVSLKLKVEDRASGKLTLVEGGKT